MARKPQETDADFDENDDPDREGGEADGCNEAERRASLPASPKQTVHQMLFRTPSNALKADEIEGFLVALAKHGQFNQAAYEVGRSPQTFRTLAMNDPGFCVMLDDAIQDYSEMLQGEAVRRGYHGIIKPVFGKVGKDQEGIIGWERVYSDRLLELELRASNKAKYYPPNQQAQLPAGDEGALGPKTGVALLPARSATHEEWEREHGPAAQGRPTTKVTRPVVARKDAPK